MNETGLILKLKECYNLADKGHTKQAQSQLRYCVDKIIGRETKFIKDILNYSTAELEKLRNERDSSSELVQKTLKRAGHRIGVNIALRDAEEFYKRGDEDGARSTLDFGRWHAHCIGLNIKNEISKIKERYNDNGLIGKIDDSISESLLYVGDICNNIEEQYNNSDLIKMAKSYIKRKLYI